jgi:hypothetical protein
MFRTLQQHSIQKGQIVTSVCTEQSGIVIGLWFNEFSGQHVFNVRVPGVPGFVSWNELCTVASADPAALMMGDMVIAFDHDGNREMGTIVGFTDDGHLMAEFAAGTFKVTMDRVWRAWPFPQAVPQPLLRPCATCDDPTPARDLKPLDSDYTYDCAVRQVSFERNDDLCPACRARFIAEHGVKADDVYSVYDLGYDSND